MAQRKQDVSELFKWCCRHEGCKLPAALGDVIDDSTLVVEIPSRYITIQPPWSADKEEENDSLSSKTTTIPSTGSSRSSDAVQLIGADNFRKTPSTAAALTELDASASSTAPAVHLCQKALSSRCPTHVQDLYKALGVEMMLWRGRAMGMSKGIADAKMVSLQARWTNALVSRNLKALLDALAESTGLITSTLKEAADRVVTIEKEESLYTRVWPLENSCLGDGTRIFLPRPTPPQRLFVSARGGQQRCAGEYELVVGVMPNGEHLWKQRTGSYWLYSGINGKWCIGGRDVKDEFNFNCSKAWIHQSRPHCGLMPHEMCGGWEWFNASVGKFIEDLSILVVAQEAMQISIAVAWSAMGDTDTRSGGLRSGDAHRRRYMQAALSNFELKEDVMLMHIVWASWSNVWIHAKRQCYAEREGKRDETLRSEEKQA